MREEVHHRTVAAREEDCCNQTDVAQGGGRAGRYSQYRRNGPGRRRGPSSPKGKMGEENHLSKTPAGGRRNQQGVYQGRRENWEEDSSAGGPNFVG